MPQTSATNERQIREARERAKRDDLVEKTIIELIMRNPEGRRWMWNQLAFCQMWYVDRDTDHGAMAFEKGLRNYGLKLMSAVIRTTPREYLTMMEEQSSFFLPPPTPKENPDGGPDASPDYDA